LQVICIILQLFYNLFSGNIHTLIERLGIEVLKRVEPSMVDLLLTTIGSNQPSEALAQLAATSITPAQVIDYYYYYTIQG
jgi:hypothetical protein